MLETNAFEWKEEDVQKLIADGVEENIHLDYKSLNALEKTDGKKKELSKDVSAFANSDGGIIIYGVKEYDDLTKRHLPEKIEDGYDPSNISKEWIEHVLSSNIEPKVNGLLINPVRLSNDNYVYVIIVPKGLKAHQAGDLRYYKRYNFESVAMKDYEIEDVRNRGTKTILKPQFYVRELDSDGKEFELQIHLINEGNTISHNFMIEISISASMLKESSGCISTKEEFQTMQFGARGQAIKFKRLSYNKPSLETVIFPQQDYVLIPSSPRRFITCQKASENIQEFLYGSIYWKLFADNSLPIEGEVRLADIGRSQ